MMDKLIMEVFVDLDERVQLSGPAGAINMITFGGTVSGTIFNGKVLSGGVDTQLVDVNSIKHMSARYMMEGCDNTGNQCRIYVENNGFFHLDAPKPFKTIPTFYTDSKALAPYLHSNKFRGEGHTDENGLVIKFFEIDAD